MKQGKLDYITVIEIWMLEIKKIYCVGRKLKQTDCYRYERKISKSIGSPSWSNQLYLAFLFKNIEIMPHNYHHLDK